MTAMFSKAPWAGAFSSSQNKIKQGDEEGESLTTILQSDNDRSALTILIADCTQVMRQSILDVFDAKQTGKKSDLVADLTGDKALLNKDVDPATVDVQQQDKLKKELEQREKGLSEAKMQELKKAALSYFDEWRDNVIQRVGEIVNSREKAAEQKDQAGPQVEEQRSVPPMRFVETRKYDDGVTRAMERLYPPVNNPLKAFPEEKRALILHSVLLLVLSLEHYNAHSRALLLHLTTSLGLSISFLAQDENKIARGLLTAAENMKADEETKKKAEENQDNRKWKVGLATVAGAALIGVTGGLAAPLLAAGVGSVMGGLGLGATAAAGYLGTLASSTVLVGGLFGAYGGKMTGKMMDQYAREVEDFAFVPIRAHHKPRKIEKEYRRLRVAVGISGWLTDKDEVVEPWKVVGAGLEAFALRFEIESLLDLGNSLTSMVKSAAWGYAKNEIIKRTVFASLTAGLWPLGLLKLSRVIDNPWSVASHRAQKAGDVLADALINKAQGERPVTLVGYSLGAKVIYTCMQRLAERKVFGLVENVVLIGAPTPSTSADWRRIRTVVSGRVVNVYSANDYILAFLYRSSSIQLGVAGLQAVENVKGIENVDVSDLVSGHTAYRFLTGTILKKIGFEDVDTTELAREEKALKEEEEKEANQLEESEEKEQAKAPEAGTAAVRSSTQEPAAAEGSTPEVSDQQVKDLEKEIEQRNEQSYLGWATEKMMLAGTSAAVAYEKAKLQWNLHGQGESGKAAAGAMGEADAAAGGVNETTSQAGVDPPMPGDVAYQGMKARSQARRASAGARK